MADTFFPSFLMADGPLVVAAGGSVDGTSADRDDAPHKEQARELFANAFVQALGKAAPDDAAALTTGGPERLTNLAGAAADIVLDNSVILQLKPGLAEGQRRAVRAFLETIVRVSATLDERRLESAIGKLADVLLPDDLADARGALASDNLELRDRFVAQVPQLTSSEVGTKAGLQTTNPYATAARWKKAGDVFSVQHRGREYFPAFQFREGRPHPGVKKVLGVLPPSLSPWQRAFWFVSTNGWLGDKAPADMLADLQAVVAAAKREGEEIVG